MHPCLVMTLKYHLRSVAHILLTSKEKGHIAIMGFKLQLQAVQPLTKKGYLIDTKYGYYHKEYMLYPEKMRTSVVASAPPPLNNDCIIETNNNNNKCDKMTWQNMHLRKLMKEGK
eukprot:2344950-Ditylum_brightwellii.AAC.1